LLDSAAHYENFPVGSWLVPSGLRPAYAAIYRFARYADDIADEGDFSDEERLAELEHLKKSIQGQGNHPIASQVITYQKRHKLNKTCFLRLLSAFSQDIEKKRYQDTHELLEYCKGSANPVGELVLGLFASDSGQNLTSSDHLKKSDSICSALQLINFLQDIEIDWQKNRVYLPLDQAMMCGLPQNELESAIKQSSQLKGIKSDGTGLALKETIKLLHAESQALLDAGRPLIGMVPVRLSLELRAICAGGQRILDLLASHQFDPFAMRPKLSAKDIPGLVRLFFLASSVPPPRK
jgi:squalene synthase HpnC